MSLVSRIRASAMFLVALLAVVLGSAKAFAYDEDTHFYEFYLMARYVGINHEVALKMANFNENIDENFWTTPMDPLVFSGTMKRAMFHFPVAQTYEGTPKAHENLVGKLMGEFVDHTQENSPQGNELIAEGLKRGNFMLVSAGFHVLMDTYGHSTHVPAIGHLAHGHSPDNPAFKFAKHQRMADTLIRALSAVRQALPESALDTSFKDGGNQPHYLMSGVDLAKKYVNDEDIKSVISNKSTVDPRFTRFAVEFLLKKSIYDGVLKADYPIANVVNDARLASGKITADALLQEFFSGLLRLPPAQRDAAINFSNVTDYVMKDYQVRPVTYEKLSQIQKDNFNAEFARRTIVHEIPIELDSDTLTTYQVNGAIRTAEILMRDSDRQHLILRKTGQKVALSKEAIAKANDELVKAILDGNEDGTYSDLEKEMKQAQIGNMADSSVTAMTKKEVRQWRNLFGKYLYIDTLLVGSINRGLNKVLRLKGKNKLSEGRNVPSKLAFRYTRENLITRLIGMNKAKMILSDDEVADLQDQIAAQNEALDEHRADISEMKSRLAAESEGTAFGDFLSATIMRPVSAPMCRELLRN